MLDFVRPRVVSWVWLEYVDVKAPVTSLSPLLELRRNSF